MIKGVLRILFGTPLFIEPLSDEEALIAELALDMMKIEFPSTKELLTRKRAKKEAAKAVSAVKAAQVTQVLEPPPLPYIESSPEPLNVPAQPPAKKWKVDEKSKKKAPAKRKEVAKATVSEIDVEPQQTEQEETNVDVDVDLPLGMSILQNKKLSVGIMIPNTVNEGRIQSHLDELMWDGLKVCLLNPWIQIFITDFCLKG